MMQITLDDFRVTATGHAGYAVPGKDIVCAGVSALMCTAAQRLAELLQAGLLEDATIQLEPGDVRLTAQPRPEGREATEAVFLFLETGCRMMAEGYSQHIVITTL